jgi:hypothetical protein
LHPHWIDTTYERGRFCPSARYSLHAFRDAPPPDDIPGIVNRGVHFLTEVCRGAVPDYRCVAFRAGGLTLSPSTDTILEALHAQGICIDSTFASHYRFTGDSYRVDFSRVPQQPNWFVAPGTPIDRAAPLGATGALFEVPIVAVPRTPLNNLPALARRVLRSSQSPPATGIPLYEVDASAMDKLKRLFPFTGWLLSFDLYWASGSYLVRMLRSYLKRFPPDAEIWASTLSHPKAMGPAGVAVMADFIEMARREFAEEIEFCSFQDVARVVERTAG